MVVAGCLPIHESARDRSTVIKTYEVTGAPSASTIRATVTPSTDQLTVSVESIATCTHEQKQTLKRSRTTERTTNTALHGLVYGIGILGVVGGGAIIADAATADTPEDRRLEIGSSTGSSNAVGIGAAAVGALALMVGIGSSVEAQDSTEKLADLDQTVAGTQKSIECKRDPASGTQLVLVLPGTPGKPAPMVQLGMTDAGGKLSVAWSEISAKVPLGTRLDGELVAGSLDVLRGDLAMGKPLAPLAHVTGPAIDPERAWAAAVAADTSEAYAAYHAAFPDSPHAAEAAERAKTVNTSKALVVFDAALVAGDLAKAEQALVTLRKSDPATAAAAQARLDAAQRTIRIANARQNLPAFIASIETQPDPSTSVADARMAIDALRATDPTEAGRAQAQLDAARKRATERLLKEAKDAYSKRDIAGGAKKLDIAAMIAVDVKTVTRARESANASALRTARSLGRERRFDEAIAITVALLAASPNDPTITATRAQLEADRDRLAKDTGDKAARDAARAAEAQRLRDEAAARVAAAQQAREDRKAREEAERAERAAAAEQARLDRKAREDAAKAQRLADAEARKSAADEQRRLSAERDAQRRAERDVRKQNEEYARLAKEAERARRAAEAQEKRAAELRKRADEAQARADQVRAGIAVAPIVRPPEPRPATLPPPTPVKPTPTKPAPVKPGSEVEEARTHFQQGVALYQTGDYTAALAELEASYRLNPQPFVLKNIGLAQKNLFRYSEAIASFERYLAESKTFTAGDPQQTQQLIVEIRALLVDVSVAVTPDGAEIKIDGRVAGTSPLPRVLQMGTGDHTIEVTAEGHKPHNRHFTVKTGAANELDIKLDPIVTMGKVRIASTVPRSTVSVDGKPVGVTPLEVELEQGGHTVELSAPKHKPGRTDIMVTAGQTQEVTVPLDRDIPPKKPWYMNRYVWAGAAAVVVGGILIGVTTGGGSEDPVKGTLGTGASGVP